jgi:hypothetical protein
MPAAMTNAARELNNVPRDRRCAEQRHAQDAEEEKREEERGKKNRHQDQRGPPEWMQKETRAKNHTYTHTSTQQHTQQTQQKSARRNPRTAIVQLQDAASSNSESASAFSPAVAHPRLSDPIRSWIGLASIHARAQKMQPEAARSQSASIPQALLLAFRRQAQK